ncbi:MAG: hypothetical protein AB8G05_04800 [Oligoflexales bacterium]
MNSKLLSLVLLIGLFGCGDDKSDNSSSQEEYKDSSGNKCNIRNLLSSSYDSDYGDVKLNISSDNSVEGEYSYDGYEGKIEGEFNADKLSIEGTYNELKERKILILPLPSSEETGKFVIKFKLTDCDKAEVVEGIYQEDGEEEWESWGMESK